MNWASLINELEEWNRRGDALDPSRRTRRPGPNPPADERTILELETRLQLKLDGQHRAFLGAADGWPEFSAGTISLLGTSEMLGSLMLDLGLRNVRTISNAAMGKYKRQRKHLLVIGSSDCTLDVICMPVVDSVVQSEVVWFNNTEPEAFISFEAFLRAAISHKPAVFEYLRKRWSSDAAA